MGASIEEEFIVNFHSLTGVTLGERRKNLFLLLKKTRSSCDKIDFSTIDPQSALEEIFKIDALLYFKKTSDLVGVLKSEHPILIEKVLKSSSFIQEAFESISGEQLTKQIFPSLSYNTKLKLLNKLSLHLGNVPKGDEFFAAIKDDYGVYLASKLLSACSETLIMSTITSHKIEITPRQLLAIVKKHPSLTETIFEKLHEYDTEVDIALKYRFVFIYLMKHDLPLFLKLNKKYESTFHLGSRATAKMVSANKDSIMENAKNIFKLLKSQTIGKCMKENFVEFFYSVFPKSIKELEQKIDIYLTLLDHLPSDAEKSKLLRAAFKKIHGHELLDHPAFMTSEVMEIMSPDYRESWLETHLRPNEISEEAWISFMKTEKSLPLLKKKISFTSNIKDRMKLVASLVATCRINKDLAALAEVCEYVINKHRNDHLSIREEFLNVILQSLKLLKFDSAIWKNIIEFIQLFHLNQRYSYSCIVLLEAYIYHCMENDLPVDEYLKLWCDLEYGRYDICKKKPKYEKKCLLMFKDVIPQCHKDEELENRYMEYLQCLIKWNKQHPHDQISLFVDTNAINALKSRLEKKQYVYPADKIAAECIISDYNCSKEANLIHLSLSGKFEYGAPILQTKWLIKNHPLLMLEYIEPLIQNLVKAYSPLRCFTPFFRYYTHLDIPQKISTICMNIIISEEDENFNERKDAVFILSYIMQPKDFLKFVSLYYPTQLTMDVKNQEEQKRCKLQQVIAASLRNPIPPYTVLEAVLNFCKGDYLKLVQKSLYVVVQNVAENRLPSFLDELMTRAVSVRKHGIYLTFKVMSIRKVYEVLLKLMKSEKNTSIRKNLFKGMFDFFLRNPDDYSWEMVKENIKAVDVNDQEAFSKLTKHKRVPARYFEKYILFVWDTLEKLPPTDKLDEEKCRILQAVTSTNITLLTGEFHTQVIDKYLFKSSELTDFQKAVHCFTCKTILYCKSEHEQIERVKHVCVIIKDMMHTCSKSVESLIFHKLLHNFVQEFCSHTLIKDTKAFSLFVTTWNNSFQLHEALDEYLLLQFTQIFLHFTDREDTIQKIGEQLGQLCDSLQEKNVLDVNIFYQCSSFFREHFLSEKSENDLVENELILAESILKTSNSPNCLSLVLLLLPKEGLLTPKLKSQCDSIIRITAEHSEPLTQIQLRHYLKNRKEKEKSLW